MRRSGVCENSGRSRMSTRHRIPQFRLPPRRLGTDTFAPRARPSCWPRSRYPPCRFDDAYSARAIRLEIGQHPLLAQQGRGGLDIPDREAGRLRPGPAGARAPCRLLPVRSPLPTHPCRPAAAASPAKRPWRPATDDRWKASPAAILIFDFERRDKASGIGIVPAVGGRHSQQVLARLEQLY